MTVLIAPFKVPSLGAEGKYLVGKVCSGDHLLLLD